MGLFVQVYNDTLQNLLQLPESASDLASLTLAVLPFQAG